MKLYTVFTQSLKSSRAVNVAIFGTVIVRFYTTFNALRFHVTYLRSSCSSISLTADQLQLVYTSGPTA